MTEWSHEARTVYTCTSIPLPLYLIDGPRAREEGVVGCNGRAHAPCPASQGLAALAVVDRQHLRKDLARSLHPHRELVCQHRAVPVLAYLCIVRLSDGCWMPSTSCTQARLRACGPRVSLSVIPYQVPDSSGETPLGAHARCSRRRSLRVARLRVKADEHVCRPGCLHLADACMFVHHT